MWDHIEGASVTDLLDRVESYTEFEEGWVDGKKEGRKTSMSTDYLPLGHSSLGSQADDQCLHLPVPTYYLSPITLPNAPRTGR